MNDRRDNIIDNALNPLVDFIDMDFLKKTPHFSFSEHLR